MRVLVTGATGFTGRRVVLALVRGGHDVVAFVRATSDRAVVASLAVPSVQGDLDRPDTLDVALRGRNALVNVASLGFGHAAGIVAAAKRTGVTRSVFLGTTAVRTALASPSKAVRLEAERIVLGGEIGATLLRPTMIYGAPGDRNMERLIRFVRRFPIVPVPGDGRGLQQPTHAKDVAAAVAAVLLHDETSGMAYDIPGPSPLTLNDVVRTVARVLGKRRLLLHVPRFLGRVVASREQIARLAEDKACDVMPAARAFGYAPRSFENGIRDEARAMGLVA